MSRVAADKSAQCRVGITRNWWHWASVARPSHPSSGPNT
jgi:hypothetical protein